MLNPASKNWYPIYYLISDQGGMYCEVNEAEIRDETADYTEIPNNLVKRLVSPIQIYCTISTQLYILWKNCHAILASSHEFYLLIYKEKVLNGSLILNELK